ncbi:hypothetical protein HPB50_026465 [Hyalomma asiaticum]|uniref:Uncharacterized protein n=1 Tax=Hyalomma asiaticum TaxID=266040 RepID=A0ACB7T5T1_HYAAI|nr:hypothetical protein HPB50_026465 [Hyalomma asiaticum]
MDESDVAPAPETGDQPSTSLTSPSSGHPAKKSHVYEEGLPTPKQMDEPMEEEQRGVMDVDIVTTPEGHTSSTSVLTPEDESNKAQRTPKEKLIPSLQTAKQEHSAEPTKMQEDIQAEEAGDMDVDISAASLEAPKGQPGTPMRTTGKDIAMSEIAPKDSLTALPDTVGEGSRAKCTEVEKQLKAEQKCVPDVGISATTPGTPKSVPLSPQKSAPKQDPSTLPYSPTDEPKTLPTTPEDVPMDLPSALKQDPSKLPYSPTDEPTTLSSSPDDAPMNSPTYDPSSPDSEEFSYSPPSSPPNFAALEAPESVPQELSIVQEASSAAGFSLPPTVQDASSKVTSVPQFRETGTSGEASSGFTITCRRREGEHRPHAADEPSSSATAENIRKKALIERAAEEVKYAIRKYMLAREITVEEYKHILRHSVRKICSSKKMGINPRLIGPFIDKYVESMKARRERHSGKHHHHHH